MPEFHSRPVDEPMVAPPDRRWLLVDQGLLVIGWAIFGLMLLVAIVLAWGILERDFDTWPGTARIVVPTAVGCIAFLLLIGLSLCCAAPAANRVRRHALWSLGAFSLAIALGVTGTLANHLLVRRFPIGDLASVAALCLLICYFNLALLMAAVGRQFHVSELYNVVAAYLVLGQVVVLGLCCAGIGMRLPLLMGVAAWGSGLWFLRILRTARRILADARLRPNGAVSPERTSYNASNAQAGPSDRNAPW